MVEAILWDNDGVLVDTECLFFDSTRTILDTIGIQLSLRQFLDLSMREGRSAFELAIERGWGKQQVAELKRERDLLYSEMLRKQTRVLPDVPETLQQLQGRIRMAVVTSSQRQHFDVMHSDTGLMRYFEFVLAREDFRALPARFRTTSDEGRQLCRCGRLRARTGCGPRRWPTLSSDSK
jgi:beta-phosphoglucomutase-like phosphatase (HAD superfamily)